MPRAAGGPQYAAALTAFEHVLLDELLEVVHKLPPSAFSNGKLLADDLRRFGGGQPDALLAGVLLQVHNFALQVCDQAAACELDKDQALGLLMNAIGVAAVDLTAWERLRASDEPPPWERL